MTQKEYDLLMYELGNQELVIDDPSTNLNIDTSDNRMLIADVLIKIPKRIKNQIIENTTFIMCSAGVGFAHSGKVKENLIVLCWEDNQSDKSKKSTIAHEIAHTILGHDNKSQPVIDDILIFEKEADDLIAKWGFNRCYSTYNINKIGKKRMG